jgi:hypothetical protein
MSVAAWAENLPEWLSPRAWTERQIARTCIPDAIFDVGAGELTAHYTQMWTHYKTGLEFAIGSVTKLFLLSAAAQFVAWFVSAFEAWLRWFPVALWIPPALWAAAFLLSLWLLLNSLWQLGAAEAYAREWKKLEAIGPKWKLWNGSLFRVVFERRDGSQNIDKRTRQQRLDEEIKSIRGREAHIVRSAKTLAMTIGAALVLYGICEAAVLYFQWPAVTEWNLAGSFACWYLSKSLLTPLYDVIHGLMERRYYNLGCQYIPAPKTLDAVHEPLTRESVEKQKAHGTGGFIDPDDAAGHLGATFPRKGEGSI